MCPGHCVSTRSVRPDLVRFFLMSERTNPRHPGFDYRRRAAYFVTLCTTDRRCLFGEVQHGRMGLNELGTIALEEWERSEEMRDEVILDAFVVMPISTGGRFTKRIGVNHLHGIVCIVPPSIEAVTPHGYDLRIGPDPTSSEESPAEDVGPHGDAALHGGEIHPRRKNGRPQRHSGSLGSMIAGFKGTTTKQINRHRGTPGAAVWQPRYHDRILCNEREWQACRRYVEQNPGRWSKDRYCPIR